MLSVRSELEPISGVYEVYEVINNNRKTYVIFYSIWKLVDDRTTGPKENGKIGEELQRNRIDQNLRFIVKFIESRFADRLFTVNTFWYSCIFNGISLYDMWKISSFFLLLYIFPSHLNVNGIMCGHITYLRNRFMSFQFVCRSDIVFSM